MGNICRSPMAEHLLDLALRKRIGDAIDTQYLNHGAGTGTWHVGEPMQPGAARQISARGGDPARFRARHVSRALIEASDLILTATAEQVEFVLDLSPDSAHRAFVLGQFGRLLPEVDLNALPGADDSPYARGVALVAAVDALRQARWDKARPADDLPDPYGQPEREFARTADTIERTVIPLADVLVG
jgi:protein-tyrosine phosphatase